MGFYFGCGGWREDVPAGRAKRKLMTPHPNEELRAAISVRPASRKI